ncbi:MAG: hypothetical protein PHR28_12795 [candidate division Zixibacteria bacterium]|jgi:hypothetical protein|nr:hypothetical protein [candidate division Zixibacteria bacterium]
MMMAEYDGWKLDVLRKGWRNTVWAKNASNRDLAINARGSAVAKMADKFVHNYMTIWLMSNTPDPDVSKAKLAMTQLTDAYQTFKTVNYHRLKPVACRDRCYTILHNLICTNVAHIQASPVPVG